MGLRCPFLLHHGVLDRQGWGMSSGCQWASLAIRSACLAVRLAVEQQRTAISRGSQIVSRRAKGFSLCLTSCPPVLKGLLPPPSFHGQSTMTVSVVYGLPFSLSESLGWINTHFSYGTAALTNSASSFISCQSWMTICRLASGKGVAGLVAVGFSNRIQGRARSRACLWVTQ